MGCYHPLLFFVRENFTDPLREGEWNEWANSVHIAEVLRRTGSTGFGARYRLEKGPAYIGWEGPSRVCQYLHVYELGDSPSEIEGILHPSPDVRRHTYEMQIRGRPLGEMAEAVRVLYRRITGTFSFASQICVTRLNWFDPDREERFFQFYSEVVFPMALSRPGFVRGALYLAEQEPSYLGWQGPSRAYKYMAIYEVDTRASISTAALQSELNLLSSPEWPLVGFSTVGMVNEVRAVYDLITKTKA